MRRAVWVRAWAWAGSMGAGVAPEPASRRASGTDFLTRSNSCSRTERPVDFLTEGGGWVAARSGRV